MGNVLWDMELCVSGGIIDEYAKKEKEQIYNTNSVHYMYDYYSGYTIYNE